MQAPDDSDRNESEEQREDRNLAELLQEIRIAGLGIQVLFGFLLSLPFSNRFSTLNGTRRDLYLITLLLAGLATALLTGPVAYHRLVFRRHLKGRLLRVGNAMALGGLAMVGMAISSAVFLVTSIALTGIAGILMGVATFLVFAMLWFIFPLVSRARNEKGTP